jgi:peptidoglycan/LPS O-acetylase OafA/YrhL/lysophospholipase L1-like esterase
MHQGGALPHRPGVDGLRALAVAAVLLYHLGWSGLPAGFLGVDVFFVISGYLITSLLTESADRGELSLKRFWVRRARRLLPALFALLVGLSLWVLVAAPDAATRLRDDLPAGLGYLTNWWLVVRDQSYFEVFARPPLLRHLWSLAVEEQFYVLFPLAVAPLLRRRTPRRHLVLGALAIAGASTLLMAAMWSSTSDPSRVWYGTDTRAAPLFIGVALALAWPITRLRDTVARSARRVLDGIGVVSLLALVVLMATLHEDDAALYHGGFLLAAVASALVLAVAAHPASNLGWALGFRPMRWLGTRSYAVYLWHWPVIQLVDPLVLQLGLTAALSELSFRVVEQPVRDGRLGAWWRRQRQLPRLRVVAGGGAVATLLVALLSTVPTEQRPELLVGMDLSTSTTLAAIPTTTATTALRTTTTPTTVPPPATPSTAPPTTAAPAPPPSTVPQATVLAIGDSVMLAAQQAIVEIGGGRVWVDAAVARHVDDGLDVLQRYRENGSLAAVSAVVIHLGTNGAVSAEQLERLLALVEGVPRVVLVNVRVPKPWEGESNAMIGAGATRTPAMRLADWYAVSANPDMLGDDGVHPTRSGARAYATAMLEQCADAPPPPPTTTTTTATTAPPSTTTVPPPPESTTTTAPPPT